MARTRSELSAANRELQDTLQRDERRIAVSYGMVGAIVAGGGVGYALDRWLGSWPWAVVVGLLLGIAIGLGNPALSLRRD